MSERTVRIAILALIAFMVLFGLYVFYAPSQSYINAPAQYVRPTVQSA